MALQFGDLIKMENGNRAIIVRVQNERVWLVVEGTTSTIMAAAPASELAEKVIEEEADDLSD